MLVCSFNIMGLCRIKRRKVRELIPSISLEFVVIHETKLVEVSNFLVQFL